MASKMAQIRNVIHWVQCAVKDAELKQDTIKYFLYDS